jgi:hypothetical protein
MWARVSGVGHQLVTAPSTRHHMSGISSLKSPCPRVAAESLGFCYCRSLSGRLIAAVAAAKPPRLHTVPQAALSPRVAEPSLRSTEPLPLRHLDVGTSCLATTHAQCSLLASPDAAAVRAPSRNCLAPRACIVPPAFASAAEFLCVHATANPLITP